MGFFVVSCRFYKHFAPTELGKFRYNLIRMVALHKKLFGQPLFALHDSIHHILTKFR